MREKYTWSTYLEMLFTLQYGSKLNIRKRSDIASNPPMYHGIITKEVDYTENEYYDLLKENNLPIPLDQKVFGQRDGNGVRGSKKMTKNIDNNLIDNNLIDNNLIDNNLIDNNLIDNNLIDNNLIVNNIDHNQVDHTHSDMTKYKLKNGQTLYVSTLCLETFPCQHECIFNGQKMMMRGNAIKKLVENHGLTFVHN